MDAIFQHCTAGMYATRRDSEPALMKVAIYRYRDGTYSFRPLRVDTLKEEGRSMLITASVYDIRPVDRHNEQVEACWALMVCGWMPLGSHESAT